MTLTLNPASARRRRDDVAGKALSLSISDCQTLDDHSHLALILGRLHSDPILGRLHGDPDQLVGDLLARFGSLAAAAAGPVGTDAAVPDGARRLVRPEDSARNGRAPCAGRGLPSPGHHLLERTPGLCAGGHGASAEGAVPGPRS